MGWFIIKFTTLFDLPSNQLPWKTNNDVLPMNFRLKVAIYYIQFIQIV